MKFIIFIRQTLSYLKNSFISLFSFIVIKIIPKANIEKLFNSLENKKILVLGTGPSLDKINQNLINKYNVIIFLNNAINLSKKFNFASKEKIVINSDLFRFLQMKKILINLDDTWKHIFIILHLQLFFNFLFFYFKKKVFLIIPKYRIGFPSEKNVNKSIITYKHATNDDLRFGLNLKNFKSLPHTVALNAFYLLISCRVNQLHYLGCDFNYGNSNLTQYRGISNFSNKKIYLWINKLKKLAKKNSLDFKDLR